MSQDHANLRTTAPPPPPQAPTGETIRTSILLPPNLAALEQGPPIPSALNAAPTAFTLMRAFQRRWPLAIGLGLLMAALSAAAVVALFPAKYVASYVAKINAAEGTSMMVDHKENPDFTVYKLTQAAYAKSRPVITRALESSVNGKFIKDLGIVRNSPDANEWMQAAIKADFIKAPEIMTVTLAGDQKEELTLLVNSLGRSLVEESRLLAETNHQNLIEQAQKHAEKIENELNQKRKFLNQRLVAINPNYAQGDKSRERLETDLQDARRLLRMKESEKAGASARLAQLVNRLNNPDAPVPQDFINEALKADPGAAIVLLNANDANKDYNAALQILGDPGHSQMRRYAERKQQADRDVDAYRRRVLPDIVKKYREKAAELQNVEVQKVQDEVAGLETQVEQHRGVVEGLETQVRSQRPANLPPELQSMQSQIESYEQALKKINESIHIHRISPPVSRVSILQDAIEPSEKDTSRQTKLAGAASIGMFLLTVLGVSFLEFRSRKITSSDEVKRGLGLSVLGTIPTLPEKARSPMAQTKLDPYWQNQIMESVDTIRTMLLHNARSTNTRVIMITSAVGGEGKTSLASQLAASLARAWKKTLLIDGDLRNPAMHKLFDVPQEPGLSEVLRGELPATEAVRSTPLSRLWVLPAGHWDNHAVQALAQDNVRTMLEELKQQYDFIILDSCPVLPVADSLLMGQNVDTVLLTVMREISRSPAVHEAHQRLERLGIKTLGAVVIGAKNELGPLGYKYAYQGRPS